MTTLRDALETAFDSAPEAEETHAETTLGEALSEAHSASEVVESASEKSDRVRDESGRFSKAEEKPAELTATEDAPVVEKTARKAPSSWKKDYWGNWDKLGTDPELAPLQDYIEQRESEFAKGVSTYREEAMKAKDLQDAVTPYMPVFERFGVQPAAHVKSLLATHHALVTGTQEQKIAVLARAAAEYGIPLQALAGGQADPQQAHTLHEVNDLRNTVRDLQVLAREREGAELQSQINAFKVNAPHFEDVREDMAGLLQTRHAANLQDAYEKAIRLNDAVWTKVQAEKAQAAAQASSKRVADKKATAVSPRSSAPTGRVAVAGGNDIRSALGAAFEQFQAGRL